MHMYNVMYSEQSTESIVGQNGWPTCTVRTFTIHTLSSVDERNYLYPVRTVDN